MADGGDTLAARILSSIDDVSGDEWDRLANPAGAAFDPFVSHSFLSALEASKSVSPEAGWAPAHLLLELGETAIGAVPLYIKGNSQGEYIFDHHWADAYHRAGGRYYPKLLAASPFTPVPGRRLLVEDETHRLNLAAALRQVTDQFSVSSLHVNFITQEEQQTLGQADFLPRIGEQYHWFNRGYESFDDFLGALSSRKRKAVRKERRAANENVQIRQLVGVDITEAHWNAFWLFYQDTGARKWGHPYLTRTFFRLIAERMPERLLMVIAESDGEPVAGALNFIGAEALYGRYWGCLADIPYLHFEVCYYQAIDFAISNQLARVEAGAQGQHKIARGYEPVPTYSAHWIADPGFRGAIENYLEAERAQTGADIAALKDFTPFRKE